MAIWVALLTCPATAQSTAGIQAACWVLAQSIEPNRDPRHNRAMSLRLRYVRGGQFVGTRMSDLVSGFPGRVSARSSKRHSIWPVVVITFGIGLTAAWIGLLGYGLIKLIELAI